MCLDFLWFSHKFLILKATRPGTVAEFRRLRPFTLVLRWMPWALGPRPLRCWSAPENLAQQILRPDRLWHTNFGYLWIMKSVILCWVLHQYSWNLFFSVFLFSMVLLCSLSRNCKLLWYINIHNTTSKSLWTSKSWSKRLSKTPNIWTMCTQRSSLREASTDLLTSCFNHSSIRKIIKYQAFRFVFPRCFVPMSLRWSSTLPSTAAPRSVHGRWRCIYCRSAARQMWSAAWQHWMLMGYGNSWVGVWISITP